MGRDYPGLRTDHPDRDQPDMLYIALGIIGATVMPHNLLPAFRHRADPRLRRYLAEKREALKFATIDSTVALCSRC